MRYFFFAVAIAYAGTVHADERHNNLLQLIDKCDSTDIFDRTAARNGITSWTEEAHKHGYDTEEPFKSTLEGPATDCMNSSNPDTPEARYMRYRFEYGQFLTGNKYSERLGADIETEQQEAEANRKSQHAKELARRTTEACFELERTDPVAAYTNPICHEVFKVVLPNWEGE